MINTPKDRRIIFFDIDGTLLDHNKELPQSAKQAVRTLQQQGHETVLASGRSPFMLSKLAEELRIDSYVSFNGQYVVMKGEKIYTNPFSREALSDLSGFAAQSGHPLVYLDHEKMSCSAIAHPDVEQSISSLEHGLPEYDPDFYLGRDIYQTMLFCKEPEDVAYREQFPNLSFVRWHALSLDVLPAGGSKANGIAQMIGKLGFTPEEAYAFGDNLNDVEMFAYVGHSVAMGNSPDSVKQLAKYVTSDVAQDGIAQGLRMVGLL